MALLWASLGALLVGPVLLTLFGHRRPVVALLDGYVMVAVGGLILLDVLPHAFEHAGGFALLAALGGLALPMVAERGLGHLGRMAHRGTVIVALGGLAVHAVLDGMALREPASSHHAEHLAFGVVLHRLPLGVLIWGVIRPWAGRLAAFGLLALEASGTGLGFFVGLTFEGWGLGVFEGLVAGALMHVVMYDALHGHAPPTEGAPADDHDHDHHEKPSDSEHVHGGADEVHEPVAASAWERQAGVIGVFLGVATLLALGEHDGGGRTFSQAWFTLALAVAPALVLVFVLAGLLRAVLPTPTVGQLARAGTAGQVGRGLVFGLPLPVCACGILPLYEGLILAGAPATAALAFLVATPELAVDAVLLSLPLLGAELTALRLAAAVVVAVVLALTLGRRLRASAVGGTLPSAPSGPLRDRLRLGLRFGLGDLVDHTLPWVVLGLALAVAAEPMLTASGLATWSPVWQILIFALAGMPFYVSAAGATPLVALLILCGLSPGAGIAFLVTGPTVHTAVLGGLARLHGRGAALVYAVATFTLAVGAGALVHGLQPTPPPVHPIATAQTAGLLGPICLAVVGALFIASLVRQGPRGAVRQITDPVDVA